jgi:hypothetical protein
MLDYLEPATCKKNGRVEEENSPGGCEVATLSFEEGQSKDSQRKPPPLSSPIKSSL